jgi:pimeloyl-ACP methyl ester carboxylesterase
MKRARLKKVVRVAKIIFLILGIAVILLFIVIGTIRLINAKKNHISQPNGIQENIYVEIGGMEQYLQIRGEDKDNPVILWLHGGPGFPLTYLSSYYQKDLEADYTIVCWEQRGCGRTYYQNSDNGELTIERLVSDMDELVDYLCGRFQKDKIIIMGQSWGTVLGMEYINENPQKVAAYIGIGQVTDFKRGKIYAAETAIQKSSDQDALLLENYLQSFRNTECMDDLNVKELEQMILLSLKYLKGSGELSSMKQMYIAVTSPEFSWNDLKWFLTASNSENILNCQKELVEYMYFNFNVEKMSNEYSIPICFIQGECDWITPTDMVRGYYDTIFANTKKFVVIENAGHTPFLDNPEQFCDEVRQFLEEN